MHTAATVAIQGKVSSMSLQYGVWSAQCHDISLTSHIDFEYIHVWLVENVDSLTALQVVAFLAESILVAGGFDGEMYLFHSQDHDWQLSQTIQGKLLLQSIYMYSAHMIDVLCHSTGMRATIFNSSHKVPATGSCVPSTGDPQHPRADNLRNQLSADFSKKLDMFKQQSASPASSKVGPCHSFQLVSVPYFPHNSC